MKIISIIPVKNLGQTKSRLSPYLNLKKRQDLTRDILERTIKIIKLSKQIDTVLIVTADHNILSFANMHGVTALREKKAGLNNALEQATEWSVENGFDALLILPSDIPFLQTEDIKAMIDMGRDERHIVVISPDSEKSGTNALFIKPPGIINYSFGLDSYRRYRNQLLSTRYKLKFYFSKSIGFDIDYPQHFKIFSETTNLDT